MTLKEIDKEHNICCDDPNCGYCPAYKNDLEKLIIEVAYETAEHFCELGNLDFDTYWKIFWQQNKTKFLGE